MTRSAGSTGSAGGSGEPAQTGVAGPEQVAAAWTGAIARTSHISISRSTLQAQLTAHAEVLFTAGTAAAFDPTGPYDVGVALVNAHFTEVSALDRTIAVLGEHWGGSALIGPTRFGQLLGALASGYAQALRDRTLAEQERISAAAFAARSAAEQARWNSEARYEAVFAARRSASAWPTPRATSWR